MYLLGTARASNILAFFPGSPACTCAGGSLGMRLVLLYETAVYAGGCEIKTDISKNNDEE